MKTLSLLLGIGASLFCLASFAADATGPANALQSNCVTSLINNHIEVAMQCGYNEVMTGVYQLTYPVEITCAELQVDCGRTDSDHSDPPQSTGR